MASFDSDKLRSIHKGRWFRLHPLSGFAILLLDNLFFGLTTTTAGLGLPLTMTLAFWTTLTAVLLIQRKLVGETKKMSLVKALASGAIAGLPFPIAGTLVGGWVLINSGLSPRRRILK